MKKSIVYRIFSFLLCMVLPGCGSASSGTSGSASYSSTGGTTQGSLHFEIASGVLDYVDYEYVSKGFYVDNSDGNPEKTIVLNFNYTNLENSPKSYQSDFWINAYQNGTELEQPSNYYSNSGPESLQKAYDEVLQNGQIKIGRAFVLQDYSPITVIAKHNGGKEMSDQMILNIDEYSDNSFDVDKLYGYWEGKNGTALTLTSSQIKVNKSETSSTYTDSPRIWTDEEYLYTNLSEVEKLKIEEKDGALHLTSEKYDFMQVENWSENGPGVELQTVSVGDTISTEFAEIVFKNEGIVNELKYSNSSGGGDGYGGNITISTLLGKEKAGTKYIFLDGTVKNISSSELDPSSIRAKLVLNGTYELEGDVHAVDGGSTTSSVNPLNTVTLVLHCGVDSSIAGEITSEEWYIGFDRNFSGSSHGDPSESRYYYLIKVK